MLNLRAIHYLILIQSLWTGLPSTAKASWTDCAETLRSARFATADRVIPYQQDSLQIFRKMISELLTSNGTVDLEKLRANPNVRYSLEKPEEIRLLNALRKGSASPQDAVLRVHRTSEGQVAKLEFKFALGGRSIRALVENKIGGMSDLFSTEVSFAHSDGRCLISQALGDLKFDHATCAAIEPKPKMSDEECDEDCKTRLTQIFKSPVRLSFTPYQGRIALAKQTNDYSKVRDLLFYELCRGVYESYASSNTTPTTPDRGTHSRPRQAPR